MEWWIENPRYTISTLHSFVELFFRFRSFLSFTRNFTSTLTVTSGLLPASARGPCGCPSPFPPVGGKARASWAWARRYFPSPSAAASEPSEVAPLAVSVSSSPRSSPGLVEAGSRPDAGGGGGLGVCCLASGSGSGGGASASGLAGPTSSPACGSRGCCCCCSRRSPDSLCAASVGSVSSAGPGSGESAAVAVAVAAPLSGSSVTGAARSSARSHPRCPHHTPRGSGHGQGDSGGTCRGSRWGPGLGGQISRRGGGAGTATRCAPG